MSVAEVKSVVQVVEDMVGHYRSGAPWEGEGGMERAQCVPLNIRERGECEPKDRSPWGRGGEGRGAEGSGGARGKCGVGGDPL